MNNLISPPKIFSWLRPCFHIKHTRFIYQNYNQITYLCSLNKTNVKFMENFITVTLISYYQTLILIFPLLQDNYGCTSHEIKIGTGFSIDFTKYSRKELEELSLKGLKIMNND